MKLRLCQIGYENFTGEFGHIDFKDGVSVYDVSPDFARSLGTIVACQLMPDEVPAPTPSVPDAGLTKLVAEIVADVEAKTGKGSAK